MKKVSISVEKLLIYRVNNSLLQNMIYLMQNCKEQNQNQNELINTYASSVGRLIEVSENYKLDGNVWHNYLTLFLINHENTFSKAVERKNSYEGSIAHIVLSDLTLFKDLYCYDFSHIDKVLGVGYDQIIKNYSCLQPRNHKIDPIIHRVIVETNENMANSHDTKELLSHLTKFYQKYGVADFGIYKAFGCTLDKNNISIKPIMNLDPICFNDLIGYESQKNKLMMNTEAFLQGNKSNNVLLYGDSGTGKSSSVKALLNEYFDEGLRIIELYKHQFQYFPDLIRKIKNRNYKFIIFMDDLSFEDFEIEYKYLKAIIEGGLEEKPDNVLIYATSNRRHLIKETWKDREDFDADVHSSDTMQEKLSLADRFGLSIMYLAPGQDHYLEIVEELAKKYNISMDKEELLNKAIQWELYHGGRSGRTAIQFINSISNK